ncbi:hypothetical protein ES703_75065 [subsurface metagenome]
MVNKQVFFIKLIHSTIFFIMVICLFYILYATIIRKYDWILLTAIVMILIDGASIALNRWRCPLTTLAEKRGAADGAITHMFKFFIVLYVIELVWLGISYFG